MSKKKSRPAAFVLPSLPRSDDAEHAARPPETLWAAGEAAEEAFDYEAARLAYREATRRSGGREALARLLGYARFLVERYGQFPEVSGWLDDPDFDVVGGEEPDRRALAALVAQAAAETGHARLATLDAALAERGEPSSLARHAERLVHAGDDDAARSLLQQHRHRLAPLSPGARLLERLQQAAESAALQALSPAQAALAARDLGGLDAALAAALEHRDAAPYRALQARRGELAEALEAEALRAAIDAALDADDLAGALRAAEALAVHAAGTDADRHTRDALSARRRAQVRSAALAEAVALEGIDRLRVLLSVASARNTGDHDVPSALQPAVSALREAVALAGTDAVATLLPGVAALIRLNAAVAAHDEAAALGAWGALPLAFRDANAAQTAAGWRAAKDRAAAEAARAGLLAEARTLLQDGELDAARARLDEADDAHDPQVRALRGEVDDALLRRKQRGLLLGEIRRAERDGRLFAARRALGQLAALDDEGMAAAAELGPALLERAARELRGTPVPPFNLKLGEGALAVGYGADRLVVVQDRLWLGVNVETRGIAPFQLPEAWPIDDSLPCRVGARHGRTRLLGSSLGRLVAYEAEPGGRPEVVQARPIAELLRGDAQILAAALEPDADVLALLSLPRGESVPLIVRIDAESFEVRSQLRHKPPLQSLCGVAADPAGLLVSTTTDARRKRGFALARYREDGEPLAEFDQQTLGEPLLGVRRAVAWPEEQRLYASYSLFDYFDPKRMHDDPSLLVLREGRVVFASAELRRRFAPNAPIVIDHPWALDRENGRLFFAALPRDDAEADASLLGVDARTLRPDAPVALEGVARVLSIDALPDGAVALCRLRAGGHGIARARRDGERIALTIDKLPV